MKQIANIEMTALKYEHPCMEDIVINCNLIAISWLSRAISVYICYAIVALISCISMHVILFVEIRLYYLQLESYTCQI